jgi:hypothetical protein
VERAYAAELRVTVPWGTLGSDPLEVVVTGLDIHLTRKRSESPAATETLQVVESPSPAAGEAPLPSDSDGAAPTTRVRTALTNRLAEECPEENEEPSSWLLSALNSFNLRLSSVSVQLRGETGRLCGTCESAEARNVAPEDNAAADPALEWLRKSLVLSNVCVMAEDGSDRAAAPLLRAEACTLQAVLPLFSTPASPFQLSFALSPVASVCDAAILAWLQRLMSGRRSIEAGAGPNAAAAPADGLGEGEGAVMSDRYAKVLAHLMAHVDSLTSENDELRATSAALTAALERQTAAIELLSQENARMLTTNE